MMKRIPPGRQKMLPVIISTNMGVEGQLIPQTAVWGNEGQQMGGKGYSNTAAMVGIKHSF